MKILLAIDASHFSRAAADAVLKEFRKGTEVRILHVLEPITAYVSADLMPHFVDHNAQLETERKKEAERLANEVAARLRKGGLRASAVVEHGDPKSVILEDAEEWKVDLIVVGSHGLKGLDRLLMGSVSDAVMRHAQCSVQVVRIRAAGKRSSR